MLLSMALAIHFLNNCRKSLGFVGGFFSFILKNSMHCGKIHYSEVFNMNRKISNVIFFVFNILPFATWMSYFYVSYNNIIVSPHIATLQIVLLIGLPLFFTVINCVSSYNRKMFIVQNSIFLVSNVIGYYFTGCLHYKYISDDAETLLVRDTLSLYSLFYIIILSAVVLIIKTVDKRQKSKVFNNGNIGGQS